MPLDPKKVKALMSKASKTSNVNGDMEEAAEAEGREGIDAETAADDAFAMLVDAAPQIIEGVRALKPDDLEGAKALLEELPEEIAVGISIIVENLEEGDADELAQELVEAGAIEPDDLDTFAVWLEMLAGQTPTMPEEEAPIEAPPDV